ncbi:MAG TPA: hypothetical protein VEI83_04575 [Acidimicrobiales bacterium]|nr:hypothetical protein [Acidimicrobiales bacterium]
MTDPTTPPDAPARAAADDPLSLTLTGVHVLAGEGTPVPDGQGPSPVGAGAGTVEAEGQVVVPGISLVLNQIGITVLKPDGGVGAVLPWSSLSSVSTVARWSTPTGAPALLVEAVTDKRTHRFLVPAEDPDELQAMIAEVVAARSSRRPKRGRRTAALVALAVVVAAGITLALLLTVGGLKL